MELGNFSVSLAVKDIAASQAFYEKLGFSAVMGKAAQKWLIMRNGDTIIGLFQGMFERNGLTFNPGWDRNAQPLGKFTDVRELQRQLRAQGVTFLTEADESTTGPGGGCSSSSLATKKPARSRGARSEAQHSHDLARNRPK